MPLIPQIETSRPGQTSDSSELSDFFFGMPSEVMRLVQMFFNEYRQCIGHLGFANMRTPPNFESKEHWELTRSSKVRFLYI
jgi:hypothetical protein